VAWHDEAAESSKDSPTNAFGKWGEGTSGERVGAKSSENCKSHPKHERKGDLEEIGVVRRGVAVYSVRERPMLHDPVE